MKKKNLLAYISVVAMLCMNINVIYADDSGDFYEHDGSYYIWGEIENEQVSILSMDEPTPFAPSAFYAYIPEMLLGYPVTSISGIYLPFARTITIPASINSFSGCVLDDCLSVEELIVDAENPNYVSIDGNVFNKDATEFVQYATGKQEKEYIVPDTVTTIRGWAFAYSDNLTDVKLSDNITTIGERAFSYCNNLTDVTLSNGMTRIDESVFCICSNLTSVTIPKSIKSIGFQAFNGCRNLKTVYYTGTEEEWNNVDIGFSNAPLQNAEIVYNYIPTSATSASAEIVKASSTPNSLKFTSSVKIEGEPEIATFGTTFIPLWLFETGSADVATVSYDNLKYDIQNGQTFGATLGGIPETDRDTVIVGKSFIKDADGNYTWSAAKSASVNNPTLNEVN